MIRSRFIFMLATLCAGDAYALSLDDVLASSYAHAPQIARAQAIVKEKDAQVQEAQGAFDWQLNSTISQRTGIYNGNFADTQVIRRLAGSNARIYAGYRASNGALPVYEDYYNSSTGGEMNIGVAFALLRDRIIDEERFQFRDAVLAKKQQEAEAYLTMLRTQHDAMVAYAQWLGNAHAVEVMQELVDLAQERQEGLKTRVAAGDIARINLTENQQMLARRQAQLADARRALVRAAQALSIFYRDASGMPLVPTVAELPDLATERAELYLNDAQLSEDIRRAQSLRPEMIRINFSEQRERNRRLLGENARLPKLDLALEGAQNLGRSAGSDAGEEGRVLLQLSIPLQQNIGDGRVRAADARLEAIEEERRLLNDQIAVDIRTIAAVTHQTADEIRQLAGEVEAAEVMRRADAQRFSQGDVDFFLLNMREERLADAKLRKIYAQRLWLENLAMLYFMTLNNEKLIPGA